MTLILSARGDAFLGLLTQLAGQAGCVSETGSTGACADGTALDAATSVTVSPDGKHVYVALFNSDAVAVFARDKTTGALTQLAGPAGCVSEDGTGGACADGTALLHAASVAVRPDGKHVYAASQVSDAVAVFARDKTGRGAWKMRGPAGRFEESAHGRGGKQKGRSEPQPDSLIAVSACSR
jgi:DNA-binding beta-propeller fold protein YncE